MTWWYWVSSKTSNLPTLSKPQGVLPVSLVFLINSLISLSLRAHVAGSEYPLGWWKTMVCAIWWADPLEATCDGWWLCGLLSMCSLLLFARNTSSWLKPGLTLDAQWDLVVLPCRNFQGNLQTATHLIDCYPYKRATPLGCMERDCFLRFCNVNKIIDWWLNCQMGVLFPYIWKNKNHVPNHQAGKYHIWVCK